MQKKERKASNDKIQMNTTECKHMRNDIRDAYDAFYTFFKQPFGKMNGVNFHRDAEIDAMFANDSFFKYKI